VTEPPEVPLAGEPPHNIEAERIALGAMMLDPRALDEITDVVRLRPEDHYRPAHRAVHEAILRLREAKEPTDPVAVLDELQRAGELRGSLDGVYLHHLIEVVPTPATGAHHARIVAEHAATWRAQEGLTRALDLTRSPSFRPSHDMDRVRALVDEATGEADARSSTAEWLSAAAWDLLTRLEKPLPPGLITPPYADLRKVIPTLRPGQLVTIAARPSIGKSLVAGDFVRHAGLRLGLPVAWFTLEMSTDEVISRIFAAEAVVSLTKITEHDMTGDELDRLGHAAHRFDQSRILIDEKSAATLGHIRAGLRRMARTAPPAMAVVDYIQLAESPGAPSRQEEVSRLARGLKQIAKDCHMPVIMAAQLNRGPETRHDKRPLQADLRESGELENSSDIVILLHREGYYDPDSPRAGEMDLIVTKNRNGPNGVTVTVSFQGPYCRCTDLSRQEPPREWAHHPAFKESA
jgi:replicative DNA helicase